MWVGFVWVHLICSNVVMAIFICYPLKGAQSATCSTDAVQHASMSAALKAELQWNFESKSEVLRRRFHNPYRNTKLASTKCQCVFGTYTHTTVRQKTPTIRKQQTHSIMQNIIKGKMKNKQDAFDHIRNQTKKTDEGALTRQATRAGWPISVCFSNFLQYTNFFFKFTSK